MDATAAVRAFAGSGSKCGSRSTVQFVKVLVEADPFVRLACAQPNWKRMRDSLADWFLSGTVRAVMRFLEP